MILRSLPLVPCMMTFHRKRPCCQKLFLRYLPISRYEISS